MAPSDVRKLHPNVPRLIERFGAGGVNRREFLPTATLLGLSAPAAYGVVGNVLGTGTALAVSAQSPKKGGVLRISMRIPELRNPHRYEWLYESNCARQVTTT